MGFAVVAWSALAASASLLLSLVGGPAHFSPNACASVSAALPHVIVGQPAALAAIADAVCDHLAENNNAAAAGGGKSKRGGGNGGGGSGKPLVLSAHGPPGVGKSAAHAVLAAALYSPSDLSAVLEGISRAEEELEREAEEEEEEQGGTLRRRRRRKNKPPPPPPLPTLLADCPGKGCPGYRVLFGLDYSDSARSGALAALRESLLEHVAKHPQSLIVVEEYDKLDCDARGLIRQLFGTSGAAAGVVTEDKAAAADGGSSGASGVGEAPSSSSPPPRLTTTLAPSLAQSIILLESNAGYAQLHELLEQAASNAAAEEDEDDEEAKKRKRGGGEKKKSSNGSSGRKGGSDGDAGSGGSSSSSSSSSSAEPPPSSSPASHLRDRSSKKGNKNPDAARLAVPLETAARALKDLVFARWVAQRCEPRADSARALAAIDHFLPFYPLERPHLERLLRRRLAARSLRARREDALSLEQPFSKSVVAFLADRADFDGRYPVEGGKEASALVTRYVTRALADARRARRERAEALREAERALAEAAAAAAAAAAEAAAAAAEEEVEAAAAAAAGDGSSSSSSSLKPATAAAKRAQQPPRPAAAPVPVGRLRIPPARGRLAVSADGKRLEVVLLEGEEEEDDDDVEGGSSNGELGKASSSSSDENSRARASGAEL